MKGQCYLVLDKKKVARMSKKAPSLAADERAILVTVTVPDEFFEYSFARVDLNIKDISQTIQPEVEVEYEDALNQVGIDNKK